MQDPRLQAGVYLQKHKISTLVETLCQRLVTERPENPRSFLVECLLEVKKKQQSQEPICPFTDDDLVTLFKLYNVTDTATGELASSSITQAQYLQAMEGLGVNSPAAPDSIGVTGKVRHLIDCSFVLVNWCWSWLTMADDGALGAGVAGLAEDVGGIQVDLDSFKKLAQMGIRKTFTF